MTRDIKDGTIYGFMTALHSSIGNWLEAVDDYGKQTVSTDKGIEATIELVEKMKEIYDEVTDDV